MSQFSIKSFLPLLHLLTGMVGQELTNSSSLGKQDLNNTNSALLQDSLVQ